VSIVGFIESLDRLSFGGRVNTPSRLKHCLAWNGMLYKLLWHHRVALEVGLKAGAFPPPV
jgi:hypothetical protein